MEKRPAQVVGRFSAVLQWLYDRYDKKESPGDYS